MKRTAFDKSHDQRVADENGPPQDLMCHAHGCPNLWTVDSGDKGIHKLCSSHAWRDPREWPMITEELNWNLAERARRRGEPEIPATALTWEDKRAILAKLAELPKKWAARDPKEWAFRLRDRETAGERLSSVQKAMWRSALGSMGATE